MANTQVAQELVAKKFLSDFFREYVRNSRFSRYTGTSPNNVITIKEGRKHIEVPLVTRLTGGGVTGSNTLRGNGEAIGNYGLTLRPTYKRHAVEFDREELEKPAIDLMKAARPLLMEWAKEKVRDEIIEAMGAIYDGTTYAAYGNATESAKDDWLENNVDRVLFGTALSNTESDFDHSDSIAKVTDAMTLSASVVSLMKRMAKRADPHIRPIKTSEDEEWYVLFANSYAFRDLKVEATMNTANREAWTRGKSNPLFRDGDLIWDGVIIREIPEIPIYEGVGADSADVGPVYLCGAQALCFGLGQRPRIIVDKEEDYQFQPGVAVELKQDIRKSFFNDVQHGMVTAYLSAEADA